LAEIYYILAECNYRIGNNQQAADLFNAVRKRNFTNNADPNPVNVANIDKYRILDEWSMEYPIRLLQEIAALRKILDTNIKYGAFLQGNASYIIISSFMIKQTIC
jgi:hypothetical protein